MIAPLGMRRTARWAVRDPWLLAGQALTAAGLTAAAIVTVRAHLVFGYADTASHVVIPRRVFDNAEPGFAQLGTHWTPLYHMLQLPFVWLDALYANGASGVLVSALASLATSLFLYKLVTLVGGSRLQGFAAAAILVASPSFLYAGVIPMLPATMMATATANVYFLTRWTLTRRGWDLILAGLTLTLATLSHYDAWILVPAELGIVFLVARRSWRSRPRTEATLLLWSLAGGYGIGVFLLMNVMIFGRPLAFLDRYTSEEPSTGEGVSFTATQLSPLADYPLAAWLNAGPVLALVAALGGLFFLWSSRADTRRLVSLLLFYPFFFYAAIAFAGIDFIGADPTLGDWVNLRYGTPILPAFAFLAVAGFRNRILLSAAVVAVAVGAVLMIRNDRVAAWEDARYDVPVNPVLRAAAEWLGERSGNSRILIPVHNDLVDRFELQSGRPADAFIDANDRRTLLKFYAEPDTLSEEGVEWIALFGGSDEDLVEPILVVNYARLCHTVRTKELALPSLRIYAVGRGCAREDAS